MGRAERAGGEILIGAKGYAGRVFAAAVRDLDATIVRPGAKGRARGAIHLRSGPPAHRVDLLDLQGHPHLERHGARTLHNLRARIAQRFLALAASVALSHRLGRPSHALADYLA